MKNVLLLMSLCFTLFYAPAFAVDEMEAAFLEPPDDTRPGCYWYFLKDDVSKEGITKDLEAMARVGIGRAYIGYINQGENPPGDNKVLSEIWWERLEHTFLEADRLGIAIGLFNCPGWSQSGGPWMTPERSMRNLVNTEITVSGPMTFDDVLPGRDGYFETVKVLAFPAPTQESVRMQDYGVKITTALVKATASEATDVGNMEALFDGDFDTAYTFPKLGARESLALDFAFEKPFPVQSIIAKPVSGKCGMNGELLASDNGKDYEKVADFSVYHGHQGVKITDPMVAAVPPTTAKFYRLMITGFRESQAFGELMLSPRAMLDKYTIKQLGDIHPTPHPVYGTYEWKTQPEPTAGAVAPAALVDITDNVDATGRLKWNVPEGDWVIARFAMVSTGSENGPAMPDATGLECDKMSKEHIRFHFQNYIGKVLEHIPPENRKSFKYVIQDSYETGPQNWTDGFLETFYEWYQYDAVPWLPVTSGRIVGSADASERFLWDLRRLVADRVASEYVGGLTEASEENGLKGWLENYGHWGYPSESLLYGKNSTEIGGEFWLENNLGVMENRMPASCAHIYGKREVYAEAFTSGIRYQQTPKSHFKHYGDWAFAEGINHLIFHVYIHQPRGNERPGVDAWFGTNFTRHNTWFNLFKGYADYTRRVNVMLRRGTNVADIAYFTGESAPKMDGPRTPALPRGYDYDFVNGDVILNRMYVQDGRICIPDGPSYRVMVLPDVDTMRPEIAAKVKALAEGGAVICGPRPVKSPSLENYPECDEVLQRLAEELWGSGLIRAAEDMSTILADAGVQPDFSYTLSDPALDKKESMDMDHGYASAPPTTSLRFAHRREAETDIYFVANMRQDRGVEALCSFRVGNRKPEIWDAVTGEMREAASYSLGDGRVTLPMAFAPQQSYFFVFRKPADADGPQRDNEIRTRTLANIEGPWTVRFDPEWGGPAAAQFDELVSWSERPEPGIKYYSGEAVYETTFTLDALPAGKAWLELGDVGDLAAVRLNGQQIGFVWVQPWRIEISEAITKGENRLEITVANTWNNRFHGDSQEEKKYTKSYTGFDATRLLPAGLFGPITVEAALQTIR